MQPTLAKSVNLLPEAVLRWLLTCSLRDHLPPSDPVRAAVGCDLTCSRSLPLPVSLIRGQAVLAHSPQAHLISPQTATRPNASGWLRGPLPPSSACSASLLCPPTTSQSLLPTHSESLQPLASILDKASAPAAPCGNGPSPIYPPISPRGPPPDNAGPALGLSQCYRRLHWFSFHVRLWSVPCSSL